jgi:superoxide dismutase, Cu-Zn family
MRRHRRIAVLGLIALIVPAVALVQPASGAQQAGVTVVWGTFGSFSPGTAAVTYNPALVPFGAKASSVGLTVATGTVVTLSVHGLLPGREYGAHVHTQPCGADPADAGGHYQNMVDPHQPSTDPAFANNRNEIWLDFTTDAHGNGFALSTVDWGFTDRHAHSVMIHDHHTHAGGAAGARLACVNASF